MRIKILGQTTGPLLYTEFKFILINKKKTEKNKLSQYGNEGKYNHLPVFQIDWVIIIFSFERDAYVFNSFLKKHELFSVTTISNVTA